MEYSDIFASVVFVKLPPYSPDLNPIEQVWRITRRENTHNVFFPILTTLKDAVDRAFHAWAAPNAQLRSPTKKDDGTNVVEAIDKGSWCSWIGNYLEMQVTDKVK